MRVAEDKSLFFHDVLPAIQVHGSEPARFEAAAGEFPEYTLWLHKNIYDPRACRYKFSLYLPVDGSLTTLKATD